MCMGTARIKGLLFVFFSAWEQKKASKNNVMKEASWAGNKQA